MTAFEGQIYWSSFRLVMLTDFTFPTMFTYMQDTSHGKGPALVKRNFLWLLICRLLTFCFFIFICVLGVAGLLHFFAFSGHLFILCSLPSHYLHLLFFIFANCIKYFSFSGVVHNKGTEEIKQAYFSNVHSNILPIIWTEFELTFYTFTPTISKFNVGYDVITLRLWAYHFVKMGKKACSAPNNQNFSNSQ